MEFGIRAYNSSDFCYKFIPQLLYGKVASYLTHDQGLYLAYNHVVHGELWPTIGKGIMDKHIDANFFDEEFYKREQLFLDGKEINIFTFPHVEVESGEPICTIMASESPEYMVVLYWQYAVRYDKEKKLYVIEEVSKHGDAHPRRTLDHKPTRDEILGLVK